MSPNPILYKYMYVCIYVCMHKENKHQNVFKCTYINTNRRRKTCSNFHRIAVLNMQAFRILIEITL